MSQNKMLPDELLRLICEFTGDPAATYGLHLAGLVSSERLRDCVTASLGRIARAPEMSGSRTACKHSESQQRRKPQKRWRRRCGWETQQLYERPHDALTVGLARAFFDPGEQKTWQAALLALLCDPLEVCRELLIHGYPRRVGPLFRAFYDKLTPLERGDVACYAMLECRENYYPKLLDDYSFSFAHRGGTPLYLAIAKYVHFRKILARQIAGRPEAFRELPWKEILEWAGGDYPQDTPGVVAILSATRNLVALDPHWLLLWIIRENVSALFGQIKSLVKKTLWTRHAHALVRDIAPLVCTARWNWVVVSVLLKAFQSLGVHANMDPLIFGTLDAGIVDEILESRATWIHAETLVRMLALGWQYSVHDAVKNERVRAWTCHRAWTLLPPRARTRDIRSILGLGDA